MKIAFVDPLPLAYHCRTPLEEPLGGAQSAVAYLSAALARQGEEVTVVNGVPAALTSEGVRFVGLEALSSSLLNGVDAVVVVSEAQGKRLRASGVRSPMVLWCHYADDQPAVQALRQPEERSAWSGFAVLSQWQARRYAEVFGVQPARLQILRNAISPAFLALPQTERGFLRREPPVLVYTSTPFRGLDVLLEAFPAIREGLPGARLRVYSGMALYRAPAQDAAYASLYARCRSLPGAEYVGPIPQRDLAQALSGADVHAYPCTFPETACIAAMEAMAAGLSIVTTRLGALEETTAGFAALLDAQSDRAALAAHYADFLVRQVREQAANPTVTARRLSGQREFARARYSWDQRALEWARWLRLLAREETPQSIKELGDAQRTSGNLEGAIANYRLALAQAPGHPAALYNLGLALREQGGLAEAEQCFRRLAEKDPNDVEVLVHLGSLLVEMRREPAQASELLSRAVAIDPASSPAHYHLGLARQSAGDAEGARRSLEQAVAADPDSIPARMALSGLLTDGGLADEAAAHCRAAIERVPTSAELHNNLGCALMVAGRTEEAISSFRAALELDPGSAEANLNLGDLHARRGAYAQARTHYAAGLALRPEDPALAERLLFSMQQLCDWSRFGELSARRRRNLHARPDVLTSPFSLLSIPSSAAEQLACARTMAQKLSARVGGAGKREFRHARVARKRLRVGYLSADLHDHVTAYVLAEVLELHDRTSFEVYAYSYGPRRPSPLRSRLVSAVEHFVELGELSDSEAAARIHQDGIDILVDLNGYTQRARTEIAALRPAPVQVNWLGYPGSLGAGFVDYLIADRFVVPAQHRIDYSEQTVWLPGCYAPVDRKRHADPPPSRSEAGLPEHGFVFCCFNQTFKILPDIFGLWMRLLKAVPGSVLWLLEGNSVASDNLRREAANREIDPSRIVIAPRGSPEQYLGRLAAADLFLDTFPYNAHTTAADALWMGLPVLTLAGETFASRVAGSMLSAAGVPELITRSAAEYEATALRLARMPAELRAMRERLHQSRASAVLFDTPRFAAGLEAAYRRMFEVFAAGKRPVPIEL